MSTNILHILLTGPTGYIGGSVLTSLLAHSLSSSFRITVLVRDPAKVVQFATLGVRAVVGTYSEHDLLSELASDADVVFACVDADDLAAANAILCGLKQRFHQTGTASSLIHTSGTGVLTDNAGGMHANPTIYSDMDIAQLETLSPSQPHRDVDLALVRADTQGYIKTYIVLPGTIYGIATGPLVDLQLQNSHSQQIPSLVRIGIARGQAGVVGLGKNLWPHVHISDVVDLYILIFDKTHSPQPNELLAHGRAGFYFAENGEYIMHDLAATVAHALYSRSKSKTAIPTPFRPDEMRHYFPHGTMFGTNSRCRADRSRAMGWTPRNGHSEFLESVEEEVPS